jgi:hypothetical protein
MKPVYLVACASLAANVALGAFFFATRSKPVETAPQPVAPSARNAATATAAAKAATVEALLTAVKDNDPRSVRDHLRALGFPDPIVRSMVRAMIWTPITEFQKSITLSQKAKNPYQQMPLGMFSYNDLNKEQREKLRQINRDAYRQLDTLLGPDPLAAETNRLSFLPAEKSAKIDALEHDYNDLRSQVLGDTAGFRLPADEEKLAYLEKEKRQDLAGILSPEELAEYDLRNSPTAGHLRAQLSQFDATSDEYKAIFAAQKSFDDRFARGPGSTANYTGQDYAQAQQEMTLQLRAALGEERFQQYQRSQNPDYRSLEAAARRFDLPQSVVDQTFNLRDQVAADAQRVGSDPNLSDEQRQQQLANLAAQARNQIRATLGPEVGNAYLQNSLGWLDALQHGHPISVAPNGNIFVQPAPPPAARTRPPQG